MSFSEESSLYELLEVGPDATPQEIRAAYLRAKTAYKKDSLALYSLMSEDDTENLLRRVEQAYLVLSNPERRKEYDRLHGLLGAAEEMSAAVRSAPSAQVVSIDRVPPMESGDEGEDLLVAPSTDFSQQDQPTSASTAAEPLQALGEDPFRMDPDPFRIPAPAPAPTGAVSYTPPARRPTGHALEPASRPASSRTASEYDAETLKREIAQETEWRGAFLRRVREARAVSLEDLSSFTKISKTYLGAIEEENYGKLPAAVYLRGFVTQVAKALRLPQDKVAAAYMARHAQTTAGATG
jgi:curved DNA-binding protein CbpA